MTSTVFVLACSATKTAQLRAGSCLARSAYAGQLFTMARDRIEAARHDYVILSGKYGFVSPLKGIAHYEQRIEPVRSPADMPHAFEHLVGDPTGAGLRCASRIIVIGGRLYAEAAAALLRRHVEAPIAGLPIGRMLQAIKRGTIEREIARDIPHRPPALELAA
jgi:hypothetical protein